MFRGDELWMLPNNVSSVIDLLEAKGISWAEYQEDMPYTGFQGFSKTNAQGKNDYVRKHNPASESIRQRSLAFHH